MVQGMYVAGILSCIGMKRRKVYVGNDKKDQRGSPYDREDRWMDGEKSGGEVTNRGEKDNVQLMLQNCLYEGSCTVPPIARFLRS